jgi:hypothetical protein
MNTDKVNPEYQFERDKTIEIVGNCANCGVEYHIHKNQKTMNLNMKTIREHFELFPEPYRTQAIQNMPAFAGRPRKVKSGSIALWNGFDWGTSNEGSDYWDSFCRKLEEQEDLTYTKLEK